jgi:F-type H+-transporting ATPase subunit a
LESFCGNILEPKVVRWAFPLIATFFIFILAGNLMELIPGIGSIGYGRPDVGSVLPFGIHEPDLPIFRPPTADANMTVALAGVFFIMSTWWAIRYNGVGGLIKHLFGVKGGIKGPILIFLVPIFIFVGGLEVISISIRPVALAMRLFGNMYGGDSVLHIMLDLAPFGIAAIPFYFFELMVCVVQALVFTILSIAFISTLCSHTEEGVAGGEHH